MCTIGVARVFAITYGRTKGLFSSALIFSENIKKKSANSSSAYIVSKNLARRFGYEENPTNTYTQFWSEHT